jgi:predicted CoA-binding protein
MAEDTIRRILTTYRTWAIVGASPDHARPAHFVPSFLQQRGYRIIPVNPNHAGDTILGERCYATLLDVPADEGIEVVDLFRRAPSIPPHVDEAIRIGAKAIWMQAGIVNDDAAATAEAAGLDVVMDACPKIEIPMLLGNSFRAPGAAA